MEINYIDYIYNSLSTHLFERDVVGKTLALVFRVVEAWNVNCPIYYRHTYRKKLTTFYVIRTFRTFDRYIFDLRWRLFSLHVMLDILSCYSNQFWVYVYASYASSPEISSYAKGYVTDVTTDVQNVFVLENIGVVGDYAQAMVDFIVKISVTIISVNKNS